ncbi:hypothetical protein AKJ63_00130 [candidate division MSBL1 archaeon SCGC-AAA259D18]|uniref:HD domain-containing protein n=1 Tax=candidate division MSBL1 archaeon SCGC-AAA259D18 TaxID=1698262 RepID=A0A133UCT7_9EURY|nr:hypothetical protein AKJ63_00130 [candidate division MSBL1 archaeon SCGC-AAA259D18]
MLSQEKALKILEECGLPQGIVDHSKAVSKRAGEIAGEIEEVDEKQLKIAGLLHDIGKARCIGNGNDKPISEHSIESKKMLEEIDQNNLAEICEKHSFRILAKKDLDEYSLEDKILIISDMQTKGSEKVSLEKRYEDLLSRYPNDSESLKKALPKLKKIRSELESTMMKRGKGNKLDIEYNMVDFHEEQTLHRRIAGKLRTGEHSRSYY